VTKKELRSRKIAVKPKSADDTVLVAIFQYWSEMICKRRFLFNVFNVFYSCDERFFTSMIYRTVH